MLINDEPLSEYNHIHHEAIDLDFPLFFRDESVVLFGGIYAQKT